jgi:hypothetical protein
MASTEPKISKQTAAGTTRNMTITILQTLDIIRKPGSAKILPPPNSQHIFIPKIVAVCSGCIYG